ncbi:hypothetical protein E2C01_066664 [Portunus trituberculatus]|uniref:Uncharacterized protein n=1 Tax=Portunus trituberculatus TaxID=210409 RepID=A0A5B7HHR0_PORTR|nr:hypothetical protein [Portunus trituberculatus]
MNHLLRASQNHTCTVTRHTPNKTSQVAGRENSTQQPVKARRVGAVLPQSVMTPPCLLPCPLVPNPHCRGWKVPRCLTYALHRAIPLHIIYSCQSLASQPGS